MLRRLALDVWEFVVGEDWLTALGVVVAIALTALTAHETDAAWLALALAVPFLLALSVWRVLRRARHCHDA